MSNIYTKQAHPFRGTTNYEGVNTVDWSFCGSTAESSCYSLLDPAIKSQDDPAGFFFICRGDRPVAPTRPLSRIIIGRDGAHLSILFIF